MIPLAKRLRPKTLEQVVGQSHLVSSEGWISRTIALGVPLSVLFYGPPGSGKSTLAQLYAQSFSLPVYFCSAVEQKLGPLKEKLAEMQRAPLFGKTLLVLIDEIHRFHAGQQDFLLPFVEEGSIILIGATTENPSVALNQALLSRLRVLCLSPLKEKDLAKILDRYEKEHSPLPITLEAREHLLRSSGGDARYLWNMVEDLHNLKIATPLGVQDLKEQIGFRPVFYDQGKDRHYLCASALQKAIRGSDPDAALYWCARMLEGGEEPLFIARRLIRIASEDIGLADPKALRVALDAQEAYRSLGSPEGELALAQAALYLSLAPKSNRVYTAWARAKELAKQTSSMTPLVLSGSFSGVAEEEPSRETYLYDHDLEEGCSGQNHFPPGLDRVELYFPTNRGLEKDIKKRLLFFQNLRERK